MLSLEARLLQNGLAGMREVNFDAQISGQAQQFANLEMQISSQAQYFVNLKAQILKQAVQC